MVESKTVRGLASITLAAALLGAPPAALHAQPAASRHAVTTRVLAWSGGERLFVQTGADVRYVPGAPGKVVVTGPSDEIDDIVVDDGVIRHARDHFGWRWWRWWDWRPSHAVHIVVTAPRLTDVGVGGSGHVDLGRLAQDRLNLDISGSGGLTASGQLQSLDVSISGSGGAQLGPLNVGSLSASLSGSGWVRATGAATSLRLSVSGSGGADLGGLAVQDAQAQLSGSGSARLSPRRSADLGVSGSGAIRLLTEPARLNAHRSGSGAIIRPGGVS